MNRETKQNVCIQCGKEFTYVVGLNQWTPKYCNKKCKDSYYHSHHPERKAAVNLMRRKRLAEESAKNIERTIIFERDNWTCQICKGAVNKELKHPHPLSATIDHIIPFAEGGKHEPSNIQLAHLICNQRKGKKVINT
jgi:5-methylcytosine-specific restriction endonuclease McrA